MKTDDFFIEVSTNVGFGMVSSTQRFNEKLVEQIRRGPLPDFGNLDVAIELSNLVKSELVAYGTSGPTRVTNDEIKLAIKALVIACNRVGIKDFSLPFRDFATFHSFWLKEGCHGNYQARRDLLAKYFDPLDLQLDQLENQSFQSTIVEAVGRGVAVGWPEVERQVAAIRKHFDFAATPEDYRNVGNDCVHLIEVLAIQVFDPSILLLEGEQIPAKGATKFRLERFVERSLAGPSNVEMRALVRAAINLAQKVKHSASPSRLEAVLSATSVILLADVLHEISLAIDKKDESSN